MSEGQVIQIIIILGGFIGSLIALVTVASKWMMKRMDVKDERYAGATEEYRTDLLERTDKFYEATAQFTHTMDSTIQILLVKIETMFEHIEQQCTDRESFQKHVQEEHEQMMENQRDVASALKEAINVLKQMCEAMNIELNGKGKEWNGVTERRVAR